ncbi:WD40 repeat domain-containing protein [Frigoribacterium salinisoli]
MTRTSTDPQGSRRFRRGLAGVVGVLVLVCAVFGVLTHLQGPKLQRTSVDVGAVVDRPGQQLRFFANQAVARVDPSQVTVSPAADVTVQTDGDVVSVQFTERLRWDATYRVTVEGVTSVYQPTSSTFETRFSTGTADTWRLVRGAGGADDVLERAPLHGGEREQVWSAPGIQAFEPFDTAVAVVTDDGERSALQLVSDDGVAVEQLPLPGEGRVTAFDADRATTTLAFSFRAAGSDSEVLFSLPLQGAREPVAVPSITGQPITVADWLVVPGRDALVVRADDDSVTLVDLSGVEPPRPVGTYVSLQSVSPDGGSLVAATALQTVRVDLATGREEPVAFAGVEGRTPFRGDAVAVGGGRYVQEVTLPVGEGADYETRIVLDDDGEAVTLYEPTATAAVVGFSVSPNGQYLAVETADASTPTETSDLIAPVPVGTTTVVVDVAGAAVVASFAGSSVAW